MIRPLKTRFMSKSRWVLGWVANRNSLKNLKIINKEVLKVRVILEILVWRFNTLKSNNGHKFGFYDFPRKKKLNWKLEELWNFWWHRRKHIFCKQQTAAIKYDIAIRDRPSWLYRVEVSILLQQTFVKKKNQLIGVLYTSLSHCFVGNNM